MQVINKDITTIETGLICHQVNCTNHIGSGVAKVLINKWPVVKTTYHSRCSDFTDRTKMLGMFDGILVQQEPYICVVNCYTQLDKGYDGKLYTSYEAIEECFKTLNKMNKDLTERQIYIPYNYGSGLGGADFDKVVEIIDRVCPGVIACKI
jgi:O-acetyl-ADP-ribose deacetylase (regulator of RNase III)